MKPIEFKEQNKVYAKDQPEYIPLPVLDDGEHVISCWKFSLWGRIRILFGAKLWLSEKMFGRPLTPVFLTTEKWEMLNKEYFTNNNQ